MLCTNTFILVSYMYILVHKYSNVNRFCKKYVHKRGFIMEFKFILGDRVKNLRKSLDLSQEEFCSKLNIEFSRVNLSRVESGKQMPSAEFIKSVIETFNVSPFWLLDIVPHTDNDRLLKYELLNESEKEIILNYIDFLLEMSNKKNP